MTFFRDDPKIFRRRSSIRQDAWHGLAGKRAALEGGAI
jgi:hypothetical protein